MTNFFSISFLVLYLFLTLGLTIGYVLNIESFEAICLQLFTSQNALEEFTLDLKNLFWNRLSHSITLWCCLNVAPFRSNATLNTYATCTWKTTHLVKLWHSNLPYYLGLTSTFKRVRLIPTIDFPSRSRLCHLRLPSRVFQPNYKLCLVWGLGVLRPTPRAPFLKPSLVDIYVAREHVKLGVEPNPTLKTCNPSCHGGCPVVVRSWVWIR